MKNITRLLLLAALFAVVSGCSTLDQTTATKRREANYQARQKEKERLEAQNARAEKPAAPSEYGN